MSETNSDLAIRSKQVEPWACSAENRKRLEQYAGGRRHTIVEDPGSFRKLALSGDGNTLVAATERVLCVFNTRTRERLDRFVFDNDIEHVAINGDGQDVYVADAAHAIHVIDMTFTYRCQVTTRDKDITAMAVDSDGSRLAIADSKGGVDILDTSDFGIVSRLKCGFVPRRIAIRDDRGWLLAFAEREIAVYRLSTAKRLARYGKHKRVSDCFDLAGEFLVTDAQGGFIVQDSATGDLRFAPTPSYKAFDTTPEGSIFVTARNSGLFLWDANRGEEIRYVRSYVRAVADVKICDEGQSIYVCGDNATIECFSVSGERVATFSDFRVPIMTAAATSDDRKLVVAGEDGTLAVYDLVSGKANRFNLHSCCISKMHIEGSLVATGAHDGWARVLDLDSGNEIFGVNFPGSPVQAVTLDGDRFLVTGNRLGQVQLYDLDNHQLVREFHGNDCTVRSLSLSPCRRYLMSTNDHGEALIFDYESADLINQFQSPGTSYSGCFGETGEFVYFGDGIGQIIKARPEAKRTSRRWSVHRSDVRSVRLQGNNLVSIGITDDAAILNPRSGQTILECPVDTKPYHRVAFLNAEGTRLVTGGQDGCLMFRDAADGSILAELRNLSHGFLWITHDAKATEGYGDCFWTSEDEMVQVYDRSRNVETLLSPTSKEYDDYIRIHNNQAMTMARVGMTPAAIEQNADAEIAAQLNSTIDWSPLALLENSPG